MSTEKNMTKDEIEAIYRPGFRWAGRNLDNYKQIQSKVAASKGLTTQLKAAKTLTEARKILYGLKAKNTK